MQVAEDKAHAAISSNGFKKVNAIVAESLDFSLTKLLKLSF